MKIKNPVAFALPMFLGARLALVVSACADEAKTAQLKAMAVKTKAAQQEEIKQLEQYTK